MVLKGDDKIEVKTSQDGKVGELVNSDGVFGLMDSNGNEVFKTSGVASAVNEFTIANAATGNAPSLAATGGDTNIAAILKGKGTGAVRLGQATSSDVRLEADQPIADSSGNEYLKFSKTASAVNEVTLTNAATANNPILTATGGDDNISLALGGKGTGGVLSLSNLTMTDAKNIVLDTTTGTQLGTAVSQKLGFWATTPVVQPVGAGQAEAGAQTQEVMTDSTGGTPATTISAFSSPPTQAECNNALASVLAQLAKIKADVTAVKTLEDAMRTANVSTGMMKGGA